MAAAVHADANPILFEFTGAHRGSLTDETAQRQLLHRLLIDVLALEAFALVRVSPRGVVETVDARGYAADSAEELARGVARRGLPSLERSSSVVPAEDLFSVDPARLVGSSERAPEHALLLDSGGELTGVLLFRGQASDEGVLTALGSVLGKAMSLERELDTVLRSYEFVRSILRDVSTGLLAIDPLGRVIYLNPAAEATLDVSAQEAIGADATRVFRTLVEGENVLLQGLDGDMPPVEVWLQRPDGREIPVELRLSLIRSPSGDRLGAVAIFQDLSEMRSIEERMRHRDRLATIGELAAGIAHEIGNPLTGIRGCAQILRDRLPKADDSQALIQVILEEVDRLGRLSNQVRHYVRPNAPRIRQAPVSASVDQVLAVLARPAEEAGISIHRKEPPDLPEIYHDPDQITQVLHNLIQNGVEAMAPGGGRLEVELALVNRTRSPEAPRGRRAEDRGRRRARRRESPYVRVRVSDTGPGIAEEELGRVFNPFFTTKANGLGLGLSISQTIVGEHGGFLSVVSQVGKGTTFTLDLPVDRRAQ